MQNRFLLGTLSCLLMLSIALAARAQLPPYALPIPTVVVISKPPPGEVYGDKQVITFGVGDKIYKFILKDAYTNHRKIKWPDIWEQINAYNPNFQVAGQGEDKFAKLEPGQSYTVNGFYTPQNRTFEVDNIQHGGGPGEKSHY
jgi:hypothetical protein